MKSQKKVTVKLDQEDEDSEEEKQSLQKQDPKKLKSQQSLKKNTDQSSDIQSKRSETKKGTKTGTNIAQNKQQKDSSSTANKKQADLSQTQQQKLVLEEQLSQLQDQIQKKKLQDQQLQEQTTHSFFHVILRERIQDEELNKNNENNQIDPDNSLQHQQQQSAESQENEAKTPSKKQQSLQQQGQEALKQKKQQQQQPENQKQNQKSPLKQQQQSAGAEQIQQTHLSFDQFKKKVDFKQKEEEIEDYDHEDEDSVNGEGEHYIFVVKLLKDSNLILKLFSEKNFLLQYQLSINVKDPQILQNQPSLPLFFDTNEELCQGISKIMASKHHYNFQLNEDKQKDGEYWIKFKFFTTTVIGSKEKRHDFEFNLKMSELQSFDFNDKKELQYLLDHLNKQHYEKHELQKEDTSKLKNEFKQLKDALQKDKKTNQLTTEQKEEQINLKESQIQTMQSIKQDIQTQLKQNIEMLELEKKGKQELQKQLYYAQQELDKLQTQSSLKIQFLTEQSEQLQLDLKTVRAEIKEKYVLKGVCGHCSGTGKNMCQCCECCQYSENSQSCVPKCCCRPKCFACLGKGYLD